ncbi:NADPH-dependent F420 reductase [Vibrio sp. LaRot3]|uniref:NADPH-dependent F420 reductase n=1 Tax=Vibrio sp. LaRot3 TaxID=2998829 RepID=UPI0022CE099E|nr:NAD(P)-binding domain-containing protein [Vibrio sp. LaRot3]MDA0147984.1 NAD(P)-binding domain-containing protein [Vibrio sp. LaRot3]
MKIGIIGAGFVGKAIAELLISHGHQVLIANSREPKTLFSLMGSLPQAQLGTVQDACDFAETVVVAIPFSNIEQLPVEALAGKVVLDANNYYPERDGAIAALDNFDATTSELLANHLTQSTVVKVFSNIIAAHINRDALPKGNMSRRALPVASDDQQAKQQIMALVDELGYDPIDGGSLADSWRYERSKPAYCFPFNVAEMQQALAKAKRDEELPLSAWAGVV